MGHVVLHQPPPENLPRLWRKALFNYTGAEELEPVLQALLSLLEAIDWKGSPHRLIEAMPYDAGQMTIYDLRDILMRLGFKTIRLKNTT